jgi:hypothetical protein
MRRFRTDIITIFLALFIANFVEGVCIYTNKPECDNLHIIYTRNLVEVLNHFLVVRVIDGFYIYLR